MFNSSTELTSTYWPNGIGSVRAPRKYPLTSTSLVRARRGELEAGCQGIAVIALTATAVQPLTTALTIMPRSPKPIIVDYKRHLLVCTGRSCVLDGMDEAGLADVGDKLMVAGLLRDSDLRVKPSRVDCLGACHSGPVMCVQPDGVWY